MGLLHVCRSHGLNTESPFRNYMKNNEEAELRYARAREKQIDYLEDLLREVSFSSSNDYEVIDRVNVGGNAIARDRLKADTLKFILSKLRPSKYGNKIEVTHKEQPLFPDTPQNDEIPSDDGNQ